MAKSESFDVTTGVDFMEVENAVNQANREVGQRFDFKGLPITIQLSKADSNITLEAPDEARLNALWDILVGKLVKRKVPVKNCRRENVQQAGGDKVRQVVALVSALDQDSCKKIAKLIKDHKFKKVQAAIEGDKVRVSGPSRDELQQVIAFLKQQDLGAELKFGNYR